MCVRLGAVMAVHIFVFVAISIDRIGVDKKIESDKNP